MSIAIVTSSSDSTMAAPLESQASNPLEITEVVWRGSELDLTADSIQLRGSKKSSQGRLVPDPKKAHQREYEQAEIFGALEKARVLVEAAPDSPIALARYAQALAGVGEIDEAVRFAETLLDVSDAAGTSGPVLMARFAAAQILSLVGRTEDAENALSSMTGDGPWVQLKAALAANRGDYETALDRLADHSGTSVSSYRGYLLLELNRPQEALKFLRGAQGDGEDSPSLWANLAYAYAASGSSRKAIRAARRAVVLAPFDRQMSFNLASYLRGAGRFDEALDELERLCGYVGEGDPVTASALAHAYVACGDITEGLRVLRRAQHHHSLPSDSVALAELNSNLAFLRWRIGEIRRAELLSVIRHQIEIAGASVSLGRMLAYCGAPAGNVTGEVERVHETLLASTPANDLVPLTIALEQLRGEFVRAAHLAISYSERNPLDVSEVVIAVYLRAHALGEYAEAGQMGLSALRRIPADVMLINNTAFALALAGRASAAEKLLGSQTCRDDPYLAATKGLVHFAQGNVGAGLACYDLAAQLIRQHTPPDDVTDFLCFLRANEAIAIQRFGLAEKVGVPTEYREIHAPGSWETDPRFTMLRIAASRVGVPWLVDPPDAAT